MKLYDTHTHLNDEAYAQDVEVVLKRALAAGVLQMNVIAYDWPSSLEAVKLAQRYPDHLRAVVGVHPHEAQTWSSQVATALQGLLEDPKARPFIVAIGEIGLDYHYLHSEKPAQKKAFWDQISIAHAYDLPLVIHNREAHQDTLTLLRQAQAYGLLRKDQAGVIHCYSGSVEQVPEWLKLGFLLGFDGPITFKNAKQPCACVQTVPLTALLLETDCPYLTPVPYRGKRNEPAHLPLIAGQVATLTGRSMEEVVSTTTQNAQKLFGWVVE